MRIFVTIIILLFSPFVFGQKGSITVLFTSDLHSCAHQYPKMASIIAEERSKAEQSGSSFLLLDAGDIAMGSLFHSVMPIEAVEYRALARMGYDAITYGNHDFDFGEEAFSKMFAAAWEREPGLKYPQLVSSNIKVPKVSDVFKEYGKEIPRYLLLQKGNLKIGVIGLFGDNALEVTARDRENFEYSPSVDIAAEFVPQLKKAGADYIIAISHGGTINGEDIALAKKVGGINLIISGHDHDLLATPKVVGNTSIVAAGSNGKYIGKILLQDGKISDYTLLSTDTAPSDPTMGRWVDSMQVEVAEYFFKTVGVNLADTIAYLSSPLPRTLNSAGSMELGEIIAKSYRDAAIANLGVSDTSSVIALAPYGTIRRGLESGAVTYNDAFDILPLGDNEVGYTGYPLVYAWITGEEICDLCELNASLAQYMEDVRLFFSGVEWSTRKWGIPLFKVKQVWVNGAPVVKDKLYMVVTCKYTAILVSMLKTASYGLLSANIKDSNGKPLESEQIFVLKGDDGKPVVVWWALANYLKSHTLPL